MEKVFLKNLSVWRQKASPQNFTFISSLRNGRMRTEGRTEETGKNVWKKETLREEEDEKGKDRE